MVKVCGKLWLWEIYYLSFHTLFSTLIHKGHSSSFNRKTKAVKPIGMVPTQVLLGKTMFFLTNVFFSLKFKNIIKVTGINEAFFDLQQVFFFSFFFYKIYHHSSPLPGLHKLWLLGAVWTNCVSVSWPVDAFMLSRFQDVLVYWSEVSVHVLLTACWASSVLPTEPTRALTDMLINQTKSQK